MMTPFTAQELVRELGMVLGREDTELALEAIFRVFPEWHQVLTKALEAELES